VLLCLRAEFRRRAWSWVALAVLVGVGAGAVTSVAAGARRTDSAYPRFLATHERGDFLVGNGFAGLAPSIDLDAVAKLPEVAATGIATFLPAVGRTDSGRRILPDDVATGAPADTVFSRGVDRWKLLDGRRVRPGSLDEAVASFEFARAFDVHVGSTVRLQFLRQATAVRLLPQYLGELADRTAGRTAPVDLAALFDGPRTKVRIVGIEAAQFEFPPRGNILPPLLMSRAFYERYASGLVREDFMHVRLGRGASRAAFRAEIQRLAGGQSPSIFQASTTVARNVQRSIHVEAVVLWVLAGLMAVAVLLILAQAFARQAYVDADDFPALGAIGVTRRQLAMIGGVRALAVGLVGALLAIILATAASPIWPVGLARDAEPSPGMALDWTVVGLTFVVVVLFAVAVGAIATAGAIRDARRARWRSQRSLGSRLVRGHTIPVPAAIGLQHALDPGRGRTSVPVRSAMLATALAVATVVVTLTFASSTDHLLATRRLYGWTSDAEISTLGLPADSVVAGLVANPSVRSVAAGVGVPISVNGRPVGGTALDDVHGAVAPDLTDGRAPEQDDEIILGPQTLDDLGARVGDRATVTIGSHTVRMRIVGRALFPQSGDTPGDVDDGAQVTFSALKRFEPDRRPSLVRFRVANAGKRHTIEQVATAVTPFPLNTPEPPTTITSFGRTNDLPAIVAATMAIVAVAVLANTLTTSVRRRRRDFAVLIALGAVRKQISATVAATAIVFACAACVVGVPLGLVVGRWSWTEVADRLGVPSEPRTDALTVVAVVIGMLVIANLVALVPELVARRTSPSDALHAE
jgi:ABC-type lipoprotein release transport system permease subunit